MIFIDYKDRRPIYEQIVERFQDLILKGILEPDSQLPSVRSLAVELSINPNTIQRAYGEMERLGLLYSVKGKGNFVSWKEELRDDKKKEILLAVDKMIEASRNIGLSEEEFLNHVKETFKTLNQKCQNTQSEIGREE